MDTNTRGFFVHARARLVPSRRSAVDAADERRRANRTPSIVLEGFAPSRPVGSVDRSGQPSTRRAARTLSKRDDDSDADVQADDADRRANDAVVDASRV